jgi:hypothetical protein
MFALNSGFQTKDRYAPDMARRVKVSTVNPPAVMASDWKGEKHILLTRSLPYIVDDKRMASARLAVGNEADMGERTIDHPRRDVARAPITAQFFGTAARQERLDRLQNWPSYRH